MAQCKVFVGSLPVGTKPKELRHLFQNFGIVIECDVMNRCGFIHMETPAMAETAILALHGSEFKGQSIVVEPGRAKDNDQGFRQSSLPKMLCADDQGTSQVSFNEMNERPPNRGSFGPRRGMSMGNRGGMPNRGGIGNPFGMSNRGGMNMRGGGQQPFNRSGGIGSRGRNDGNSFDSPGRGSMGSNMHGGFRGRGGMNGSRGGGGQDNRNQNESGPMRSSPNFKSRPGPYPLMGGSPNDNPRGGKFGGNQRGSFGGNQRGGFGGHQRGGFGGPNRQNSRFGENNLPQREKNWNRNEDGNQGGMPPVADFNSMGLKQGNGCPEGGHFKGKSSFMPHNAGQDRRGFTLDNPPPHQEHQFGNRLPMDRNTFRGNDQRQDGGGFHPRFNTNMRGNPNQQRGGRGGRGNFGRGRGGGNFSEATDSSNNYNKEFPALAPVRGRGGFGGNRGGFNRNAPNMMPNHR